MVIIHKLIKCDERKNNAIFKGKPTFSCCCRNLQSQKTTGGGFFIFVPVPSKNFPSGLVPWRLSFVQTTSDPQTVPLPSFFCNIFHIWNIILWSLDIKKIFSLRNILLFFLFYGQCVAPKILSSIAIHHCLHFTAARKIYPEFLKSHVIC